MKKIALSGCLLLASAHIFAQNNLTGVVFETAEDGKRAPLPGVNLVWLGTTVGAASGDDGTFKLKKVPGADSLVVSYVGYSADTLAVGNREYIEVELNETKSLDEVSIVFRERTTTINPLEPRNTQTMNEAELFKAACCNLSESFETNPSVDVSFSDAVTGRRQIEMLGLAGTYTQKTVENMPAIRGLAAIEGLTYIPGTWINSIQVTKGTGSVVNGFESVAGQINVEMKKPEDSEKLYANGYINESGRAEANLNLTRQFGKSVGSTTLLHASFRPIETDHNDDGFLDNPVGNNFMAINRWKFVSGNGWEGQAGVKGILLDNTAGQLATAAPTPYEVRLKTNRSEVWAKTGHVFPSRPYQSIGLQVSGVWHDQETGFGSGAYEGVQNSLYANLIFQSIIGNTNHKYKLGLSYQHDRFDERLNGQAFDFTEIVPGAFAEYSFHSDKLNVIAGLRADRHNTHGLFLTPRLHARYGLGPNTTLRASVGRAFRTANIFAENFGMLISSRQPEILSEGGKGPYGLEPEIAWNGGVNLTHDFRLNYRDGSISLDFYRTIFDRQVVVDRDADPGKILFYNLDGRSFSNSIQAEVNYELLKMLDVRMAYRWYDVQSAYAGSLMQRPLLAKNRAFVNMAYEGIRHWNFDYTVQWVGAKRIPGTTVEPSSSYSPDFYLMNAQVTRTFGAAEVYLGVENLLNYTQENPIMSADEPFGPDFDSSLAWGPIFGRAAYLGFRFKME